MIDTTKKVTALSVDNVSMQLGNLATKTITQNGTYNAQTADGVDGYSEVTVNVSGGGGDVSTQSQSIFIGYTAPLTWLNSTNNVFTYESATHNITITGLNNIATITGNGTKSVTVTIDTTASADRQTAFTIACEYDEQTITYNGIAFHYGSDLGSGNCLAVAQTIENSQIAYVFIESASLPTFTANTTSWNGVYSSQIIGFDFGKWEEASIGNSFLSSCYSFNQPLTIPTSVTSISTNFLGYCYSFNQPLTIPSGVTSIGNSFLYICYSFNQPLVIPTSVTKINNNFLYNCYSFNQSLTIPSGVTSIGNSFLNDCYSFNQPLTIPSGVTSIGNYFLNFCYSFNQPLVIPYNVTSIGATFMSDCYSFNQSLTIPTSVTKIGNNFLNNCYSFNQPLVIPTSITRIGSYFLYNCYSFIYLNYNASVYPTGNYSLSQDIDTKTSSDGTGIYVTGTEASGLKSALPNRTASPFRKLV